FYRRVIERVELDAGCRSSERSDDVVDAIRRAMRNGDTEADARTHGLLPLFERSENAVAIFGFDFAEAQEQIDQLDDGRPSFGRFHLGDDLFGRKLIAQRHEYARFR